MGACWARERDRSRVGLLERRDDPHERRLAGAVPAEQAEHPLEDVERDVFQCVSAAGIGLRQVAEDELHVSEAVGDRQALERIAV
jgi:hypothetical protein